MPTKKQSPTTSKTKESSVTKATKETSVKPVTKNKTEATRKPRTAPVNPVKNTKLDEKEQLQTNEPTMQAPRVEPILSKEFLEDPNISPIFDVVYYKELFMSLRRKMDELASHRDKSDKDYAVYDEAVFNLIINATVDSGAQDFLAYCYKKGGYDFCIMNFEKFMKWSILASANGNAFTLSKMQIFLTNAIEEILLLENHVYLMDFLGLDVQNYYIFISKLICEELLKVMDITPEGLIKLPETYQEQTESLLRKFDVAKMEAATKVKSVLSDIIKEIGNTLEEERKRVDEREKSEREARLKKREEEILTNVEDSAKDEEAQSTADQTDKNKSTSFRRSSSIKKKFRW
jgi:hypothetical protein